MNESAGIDRGRLALAQQAASVVTMVAFAIASARWLGPTVKGQLTLVITTGVLCGSFLTLGLPAALTAWVSRDELSVRDALSLGLPFVFLLAGLLLVGVWLAGPGLAPALTFLWFSVGIAAYEQVVVGVATGAGDLLSPLTLRVLGGGLLVVAFATAGVIGLEPSPDGAVWAYFGIWAAGVSVSLAALLLRADGVRRAWRYRLGQGRSLLKFGLGIMPALLLSVTNYKADILLLGWLSSAASVGVYAVAVSAALLVGLVPSALGQALTRQFGTEEDPRLLLRHGMQASILAGLATALVIGVGSWFLVSPVFGAQFSQASLLIAVMVPFTGVFAGTHVSFSYFCNRLRRPILQTAVIGITAAIDLVLVLVLAPRYGALGAAIASAVAYGGGAGVNLLFSSRYSGIPVLSLVVPSRHDVLWMRDVARRMASPGKREIPDAHTL